MEKGEFVGKSLKNTYELRRLIGQGNFGSVYLARDKQDDSFVAIKLFDPRKYGPVDVENEARTQARLHHPNIIPFHWYDLQHFSANELPTEDFPSHRGKSPSIPQDYPFIVMEYANNGSLRSKIPEATTESAVDYLIQAANGVQYAHDKKIVHRDLKPENLLLHQHPNNDHLDLLIADFGIAVKAHTGEYDFTEQFPKGTVSYSAPEQVQGKAVKASDIYSLGVIGFELLTGRRPFHSDKSVDLLVSHAHTPPPTFEEVQGRKMTKVLEELEVVIRKTLEKRPEDRPQSAGDFGQELKDTYERTASVQKKKTKIFDIHGENKHPWSINERQLSVVEEIALKEEIWDYRKNKQQFLEQLARVIGGKTSTLAIIQDENQKERKTPYDNIAYTKLWETSSGKKAAEMINGIMDKYGRSRKNLSQSDNYDDDIHISIDDEVSNELDETYGFVSTTYNTALDSRGTIGLFGPLNNPSIIPTLRLAKSFIETINKNW